MESTNLLCGIPIRPSLKQHLNTTGATLSICEEGPFHLLCKHKTSESIPQQRHGLGWRITTGYTVRLSRQRGNKSTTDFFFFRFLSPAAAAVRAIRSDGDGEYGIHVAAEEVYFSGSNDVSVIHVALNEYVCTTPDEVHVLSDDWVAHLDPSTKTWSPKKVAVKKTNRDVSRRS